MPIPFILTYLFPNMSTTFPNKPAGGGLSPQGSGDKDNTLRIILIAVIALLLGALGVLGVKYSRLMDTSEEQVQQLDTLNTEIADLETKIKTLEVEMSNQSTEMAEKDRLLEEKLKEIQSLQAKVASAQSKGAISNSKATELNNRIKQLESLIAGYQEEINKLKTENSQLATQVGDLEQKTAEQNQQMEAIKQTSAQEKMQQAQAHQQEIKQKEEEKKQVEEEKQRKEDELAQTKQTASVLKATDFRFFNVKKNDKEKEEMDKEFKRFTMQSVKVVFTINENQVATPGPREVFLVYENPDGSIRTTDRSGKFKFDNRDVTYTIKTNVNFNRMQQEVSMMVPKPEKDDKYQKGIQTVSVFCDGKRIGMGKFEVK